MRRLYLHCPAWPLTGYGEIERGVSAALKALGVPLTSEPALDDVQVSLVPTIVENMREDLASRRCRRQFVFTMAEHSSLPDGWAAELSRREGLIVPSTWCRDVFAAAGVTAPIHVVPLGVDPERHPYIDRPERDTFTFLWQGVHYLDRKGGELVLDTFKRLDLPRARLIMKWTDQLSLPFEHCGQRIEMYGKFLSDEDMADLLWRADCSVNPTGAEGFGLLPLEHMATGLPTIVTAATGPLDYIEPQLGRDGEPTSLICYPLKSKPSGEEFHYREFTAWKKGDKVVTEVVPDADHLAELMEHVYANRDEARAVGRAASDLILHRWTWVESARRLAAVALGDDGAASSAQGEGAGLEGRWGKHVARWGVPGPRRRLDIMADAAVGSTLDVGCGNSMVPELVRRRGLEVVALDAAAVGLASPALTYGIPCVVGDAFKLPFADGAFDTVIAGELLEHHAPMAPLLAELERVARDRIVLSLPVGTRSAKAEDGHAWTVSAHMLELGSLHGHTEAMTAAAFGEGDDNEGGHLVLVLRRQKR